MNELIDAAKAVIDIWQNQGIFHVSSDHMTRLRAAVERAEEPPAGFDEWLSTHNSAYPADEWVEFGRDAYKAAQQAERERIKEIIRYELGALVSDLSDVMEMIDRVEVE